MKKILWLPSWYPSKIDAFRGDFIQRHAEAASAYQNIHVIFVEKKPTSYPINISYEKREEGNLVEEIIYNQSSSFFLLGKFFSLINYYRLNLSYIKKYIKSKGRPDYIHVHVPIKAGIVALWIKWRYKIPFLLTEHWGHYNEVVDEPFQKKSFLFRYFTRKTIKNARIFLPVSHHIGLDINKRVLQKNFKVIVNTVNTDFFYFTPPVSSRFVFLHVSNMVPIKNVEGIVTAFEKLYAKRQDAELWLIGPTPADTKKHITSSALFNKSIILKGEIAYREVAKNMQLAHSVILFSLSENMPCVLLESLCCGRPVIASRVGGIPEIINDKNGILVNSGDENALLEAMNDLMNKYDNYKLSDISENSKALYSYPSIGKQLSEVYENC
jgi:glycosyltransferase involved in cell wall biosynthesis